MSKKTLRDQTSLWLFQARRLPAILEADEAAACLGIAPHAVPILIADGHLRPLGKPAEKSSKKFSADYIEELAHDQKWLDKAVRIIDAYWSNQNRRKSNAPISEGVDSPGDSRFSPLNARHRTVQLRADPDDLETA